MTEPVAPTQEPTPDGQEPAVVTAPTPGPIGRGYRASIFPGPGAPLPASVAEAVRELEASFGMPMWLLLQDGPSEHDHMDELHEGTMAQFHAARGSLPRGERIGLVVDSLGGSARGAYQLASFLRRRCGGFIALVPRRAKSAATLLVLGADEIVLGENGELGPLDAQIWDPDREVLQSGLDETQSLDVLHNWALRTFDQLMFMLVGRTRKKVQTVQPHARRWVMDMMRPLLERLDVVHFTQMSRILEEAQQYAIDLLKRRFDPEEAKEIASALVTKYPEHGFVIGPEEATRVGLRPRKPTDEQNEVLERLWDDVSGVLALGRVEEDRDGA
jgi:hypothetical protein